MNAHRKLPLLSVQALLAEQQSLTAVERFAQHHATTDAPLKAKYYRDSIPLERPGKGQQYAFEVDLDACTGCKACVSACHTLNGLDAEETWRGVGLLHGGSMDSPAQQSVTSACHHCVEPACLHGCPTQAYEKDPITGIVKHLDDQCFGCQYCTLMCPYDAPKYSPARGIVRKCDMCSDRLAHGEAPACVQGCPNSAIAIRVVEQADAVAAGEAEAFLPGAPTPAHTQPTTRYTSARGLPENVQAGDHHTTQAEHPHLPLVVMLTLTQLSAGAFAVGWLADAVAGDPVMPRAALAQAAFAIGIGLLGLGASVFHLGRPLLAWRAVLGLRTSWLSREALVLGGYAQLAIAYAGLLALPLLPVAVPFAPLLLPATPLVRAAAALTGLLGVLCSVMVYVATRRACWSAPQTGSRFFGSALLLGSASVFAVAAFSAGGALPGFLLWPIAATAAFKLGLELEMLSHARDEPMSAQSRMARVMLGQLLAVTGVRVIALSIGGVLLPILLLLGTSSASELQLSAGIMWSALLVAELLERYLFFSAAPASRMPGAVP